MSVIGWIVAAIFVAGLAVAGCVALINDEDAYGPIRLVSHDYGCDPAYEPCGGDEYDQWNSDQRNHNRRNRGAFSPGPFDDSPVDAFNGNTICLPGSTCNVDDRRRDEQAPA